MKGEGFLTSFNTCCDQRGTWSVGEVTGRTGRMRICRNNRFGILVSSNRFDGSVLKSSITAFDAFGRRRWSKQYQFNDGAAIMDISSDRQGNTYIVRGHNTLTFYGILSRLDTKEITAGRDSLVRDRLQRLSPRTNVDISGSEALTCRPINGPRLQSSIPKEPWPIPRSWRIAG